MSAKQNESTTSLLGSLVSQVSGLVRSEFDLARAEMDENLRRAATAIGLIVAAVVVALTALNVLSAALTAALVEMGIEPGLAALIVGVALGFIAWIMLIRGTSNLNLSSLAPSRTVENVKRDARTFTGEQV